MSIERRTTSGGAVRYFVRLRRPDGSQYARSFKTKREAKQFQATELADRARGTWLDPQASRISFAEWVDEWLHSSRPRWKTRTASKHEMAMRAHWIPALGGQTLEALTPRVIQSAVSDLAASLSPSSIQTYYGTLRSCLSDAVESDLVGRSPCRGVKLPAKASTEKRVITPSELHRLSDAVGEEWRALIYLGGVVGLRFGEATALRVCDVDLDAGSVSIRRTVVDDDGRLGIGVPKTAAAVRTLAMPSPMTDELRDHVVRLGIDGDELLFADAFGGPLRRSNFRSRVFAPAVERAGLDGLTFHGLRHSAATQWVSHGLDPRTVQHRLGHSDPRLVLQLYAHAVSDVDARAAQETTSIYWGA